MSVVSFDIDTLHREALKEARREYIATRKEQVRTELEAMELALQTGFTANDEISSVIQRYCLQKLTREVNM